MMNDSDALAEKPHIIGVPRRDLGIVWTLSNIEDECFAFATAKSGYHNGVRAYIEKMLENLSVEMSRGEDPRVSNVIMETFPEWDIVIISHANTFEKHHRNLDKLYWMVKHFDDGRIDAEPVPADRHCKVCDAANGLSTRTNERYKCWRCGTWNDG